MELFCLTYVDLRKRFQTDVVHDVPVKQRNITASVYIQLYSVAR